jgi:hypothetical protein
MLASLAILLLNVLLIINLYYFLAYNFLLIYIFIYEYLALRSGHVKQKYTPPRFSIASGPAGPVRDPRTVNVQELVPGTHSLTITHSLT